MQKVRLEELFLLIAIPLGILYILLIVPNFKPDEDQHIWRAYDVSQGNTISDEIEYPRDYWTYGTGGMTNYTKYREGLSSVTDYSDLVSSTSAAGNYYFISYIPAAAGIAIARFMGWNTVISSLLARTMNYLFFLIAGCISIRLIPSGKFVLLVYLLNPMTMYMASAISADSLINSFALLYIAYALKLLKKNENIKLIHFIVLFCLLWVPVRTKIVYFPLVVLAAPLAFRALKKNVCFKEVCNIIVNHQWKCIVFVFVSGILVYFLAGLLLMGRVSKNVDIVLSPFLFGKYLVNTIKNGENIFTSFSGSLLNWYALENNTGSAELYIVLLIISPLFTDEEAYSVLLRCLFAFLGFGTLLLIFAGCFIGWNDPSAGVISGVQGRYYIPFMILFNIAMIDSRFRFRWIRYRNLLYGIMLSIVNLMTIGVNALFFI